MKPPQSLFRPALVVSAVLIGAAFADPEPQPQVAFTEGSSETWNADWTGVAGRTYFAQGSLDLLTWKYLPVLEFGTGIKGTGIGTESAPKYYFRLVHVDVAQVTTEQQAKDADFDNDGIPNGFEVMEAGSSPLDGNDMGPDTDADGLPDGWELYYFGDLGRGPSDDPDADGINNLQAYQQGLDPWGADIDGDGISARDEVALGLDLNFDETAPGSGVQSEYDYDDVGRLEEVESHQIDATYTYDDEGNILTAQ